MWKISHILITLVIALLLAAPPWVGDASADIPTVQELMNFLGYSKSDESKLLAGEIISHGLESGSEKELAVTMAMLVRVPLSEVVEFGRSGEVFKVNRDIIMFHDLNDRPPDKDDFVELGFNTKEADEVAKLLQVEPGDTFNLSKSEIKRFQTLSRHVKAKGAQNNAVREAVNAEYQAILMERYRQFREGGLEAIAEYDREGKQSSPGKELADEAKRGKLMQEKMPEFYAAILNYPHHSADDVKNQFFWIKQTVNKRPVFILAHRMFQFKPEKYLLATFREFYVGHSYNSLHIVVGALPGKEGTVIFYTNRTSTNQVAGFGGGLKRKIGSGMLRDEVVKLFTEYRRSLEKGGS